MLLLIIFYVALFSTLEQARQLACDSKWVTSFHSAFLNIHWSGVLTVLLGCYMAGAMWNCCLLGMFCVHHTTKHHVNHFMLSHVRRVNVCLAVTCHLHFTQNGRNLLHSSAVTQGWNRYRDEWAQKVDPEEDHSPAAPARTWTHNLSILSPALQPCKSLWHAKVCIYIYTKNHSSESSDYCDMHT